MHVCLRKSKLIKSHASVSITIKTFTVLYYLFNLAKETTFCTTASMQSMQAELEHTTGHPLPTSYPEGCHCSGYFLNTLSNDNSLLDLGHDRWHTWKNCSDNPFSFPKPQSRIVFTFCYLFGPSTCTSPHLSVSFPQKTLSRNSIHLNIST